jgi:uncharacterized membrane protein YidH (DUF202 family)
MKDMKDERIVDSSGAFYLTLVSIIQSLTFGYFLQKVDAALEADGLSWLLVLRSVAVLFAIILVWHEYAMGATVYRWRLDMFDSFIPFGFAIVQYIMIFFLSSSRRLFMLSSAESWLVANSALTLVGALAYWNQKKKVISQEGVEQLFDATKWGIQSALITGTVLLLLIPIGRLFSAAHQDSVALVTAGLVLVVCIGNALRIHFGWRKNKIGDSKKHSNAVHPPPVLQNCTPPQNALGKKEFQVKR